MIGSIEKPLTESHFSAIGKISILDTSVGQFLRDIAATAPDRLALVAAQTPANPVERSWTYSQLLAGSERIAAALLRTFKPGDHVTLLAMPGAEFVVMQLGIALAGLVVVMATPTCGKEELVNLLTQSESVGLVTTRKYRERASAIPLDEVKAELPRLAHVVHLEDLENAPASNIPLPTVASDAPLTIIFTSGTTGKPKGMVHQHRSVVGLGRASMTRRSLAQGSVWLSTLPMFHLGGAVMITLGCIANAGTQIVAPDLTADLALQLIQRHRVNFAVLPMPVMHDMAVHESLDAHDISTLEHIWIRSAGAIVSPEFLELVRTKLKADGGVLYGLSESGVVAQTYRDEPDDRLCNTTGRVLDGGEIKIAHPETNRPLPIGEIGEICVRSPYLMKEYFRMPEATAEAIDKEGWLHTGDAGSMRSDGYIQIAGRIKDIILRGDHSIFPREVEDVLSRHPELAEVAVFGVTDTNGEQQVAAALRMKPGATVQDAELAVYLDGKIAAHKIPCSWMRLEKFPVNLTLKVQKTVLREMWAAQRAAG